MADAPLAVSLDWYTTSASRSTGNTRRFQPNESTLTEIRSSVEQADTGSDAPTLGSNLQVEHDMEGKKTSQAQQNLGLAAPTRIMQVDSLPSQRIPPHQPDPAGPAGQFAAASFATPIGS